MDVLFVASEVAPFAKSGGLGDVAAALPRALAEKGLRLSVVLPRYGSVDPDRMGLERLPRDLAVRGERFRLFVRRGKPDVYLVDHPGFFGGRPGLYGERGRDYPDNPRRFAFFSRAALEVPRAIGRPSALVHLNDWQTAIAAWSLSAEHRTDPFLAGARSVFTIHNLAYQGLFSKRAMGEAGLPWELFRYDVGVEFHDQVNFMKAGLVFGDALTTVSPNYAREILTVEGGYGLDTVLRTRSGSLHGILNGIDVEAWDPSRDAHLPARYDPEHLGGKAECKAALQRELGLPVRPGVPLLGFVGRLAEQKGVDLLASVLPRLLASREVELALLGNGEPAAEELFARVAAAVPDRVAVRIGFDEGLAHRIEAGSDLFLMPSRFEPCGLNQLYSLRYGTPPLVRAVGGLADTVEDYDGWRRGTGFAFGPPEAKALLTAVLRALDVWRDRRAWRGIQERGMWQDFSWEKSAARYQTLYRTLRSAPRGRAARPRS